MKPPNDPNPKPSFAGGLERPLKKKPRLKPKPKPMYFYPTADRHGGTRWT